jgi:hypothetical protein
LCKDKIQMNSPWSSEFKMVWNCKRLPILLKQLEDSNKIVLTLNGKSSNSDNKTDQCVEFRARYFKTDGHIHMILTNDERRKFISKYKKTLESE